MSYVPDSVKSAWKEASQALTAASGGVGVPCELTFNLDIRTSNTIMNDSVSSKPRFMPPAGGLTSPNSIPTYNETAFGGAATGYYQAQSTKIIEGRVYGARSDAMKEFLEIGSAQKSQNIWKFVCDKKYIPDLLRASHATFYYGSSKSFKSKMIKPPMSYGLGEDVNCISYWIDI